MSIQFYSNPDQVIVEFTGGDLVIGMCGDDEVDCIGIAAATKPGAIGQTIDESEESEPSVYLRFETPASLDAFIQVLHDYREERFGRKELS